MSPRRPRPAHRPGDPGPVVHSTAPVRVAGSGRAGRSARPNRYDRSERSRTFPPLPPHGDADTPFAATWWGDAWLDALRTTALDAGRLERGRAYARDGHVDTINITPGRIAASVRGSRPRPYSAEVRLQVLTDREWSALLDAVTADPVQLAALLAKELPRAFAESGTRLLPGPGDLVPRCSCPDAGYPCKHAAALCFQTARLLDADPFVLLLMRGRGERELLDELARRSAAHAAGEARGSTEPPAPPPTTAPTTAPSTDPSPSPGPAGPRADDGAGAHGGPLVVPEASGASDPYPGIMARAALAERLRPGLPPPMPLPEHAGSGPVLPGVEGLPFDAGALEFLAADAASRAHAYLHSAQASRGRGNAVQGPASASHGREGAVQEPVPSPFPRLGLWQDAVRLAARAHPTAGLTSTTRALYRDLAAATGRTVTDVARGVAAWRQGGAEGLALLDTTWNPPAGDFDRARGALLAADLPALRPWHNHLTDPERGIQLRFGRDHRWYPYEAEPGSDEWWPTGGADPDPVGALTALLAR
ncbi:SWIM zinc finger family protein [Streptomyces sp. NPDC003077]|uniref:SWIM zinc finger family protein n=1 Tax=Streptomyces sp. NPDC003077 TaxID=3154443 RepID=UPI0033B09531